MDLLGSVLNLAGFIPAVDAVKITSTIGITIAKHGDDARYFGFLSSLDLQESETADLGAVDMQTRRNRVRIQFRKGIHLGWPERSRARPGCTLSDVPPTPRFRKKT